MTAGRRSGKTELGKRFLAKCLSVKKPWSDPRYFFGGPTHDQAKRIAWEDLKALVPATWVRPHGIYEGDKCIRTIFGSELWVVGLDKPQRYEGVPWDGVVIDEVSDQKPGFFETSILPALSDRNGWAWLIGIPKRMGPNAQSYRRCCLRGEAGKDPQWRHYTWESSDILGAETVALMLDYMDIKTSVEQLGGRWQELSSVIYDEFNVEYNVRPCAYDPVKVLFVGADFNVDPMAWVVGQPGLADEVLIVDELFLRSCNTRTALDELWRRYKDHRGGWEFYGDSTAQARKTSAQSSDYIQILSDERFKRAGRTVHYPRHNPPVADRYAIVNSALHAASGRRRLFVDGKCERLIEDLQHVSYTPGTREANKIGDLSHMSDALGYLVTYKFPLYGDASVSDPTDDRISV